jgi:hypothetical protein
VAKGWFGHAGDFRTFLARRKRVDAGASIWRAGLHPQALRREVPSMLKRFSPPPLRPLAVDPNVYEIVMAAAAPLYGAARDKFVADVADALRSAGEIGPGRTFRVCREIFAKHFDPPLEAVGRCGSKHTRRG